MITHLITKKVKDKAMKKTKKALIYSGIVLTGIGAICSYNSIKKLKKNNVKDVNNNEYEIKLIPKKCGCNHKHKSLNKKSKCACDSHVEDVITEFKDLHPEDAELKEMVKEFNSQRITEENTPNASKYEMNSKLNKVEDTKDDIIINEDDYKSEKYEEYEYYEDDLKKEEK